jgi:hypothetical protein
MSHQYAQNDIHAIETVAVMPCSAIAVIKAPKLECN